MNSLTYKVTAAGQIRAYRGKTRRSMLSLEIRPEPSARAALRKSLDPALVLAAWAIFGSRCLPADYNEVAKNQKWVRQVFQDSPRALPLVWHLVRAESLKPGSPAALVKRAKDLLQKTGYKAPAFGGRAAGRRRENEVTEYWRCASPDVTPLSDAGWRWLVNLPYASIRLAASGLGYSPACVGFFNQLARLKAPCITQELFEVRWFAYKPKFLETLLNAYFKTENPVFTLDAETFDFLRDASYAKDFELSPHLSWNGIVRDAYEHAAKQAELSRPELEKFVWSATLPEVRLGARGAVFTATALTTGVALLEEGYEMKNCLRNMLSYAERGAAGLSLVYALGGPVRATAELTRATAQEPWQLAQVALACNRQVSEGPAWQAASLLCKRVNGSQGRTTAATLELEAA